jgi:hypothetical protein
MDKNLIDDINMLRNIMIDMSICELKVALSEYERTVSKSVGISFEEYVAFMSLFDELINHNRK